MKCPKCQAENPEGMKFCGTCGAQLERICPSCNFRNPPQFKFCGECGHQLSPPPEPTPKELSFDEKLAKIQRYLPERLAEKILAQKGKIEGERKQVAVMFCDMEGFTTFTEKLGAEKTYSIMDEVYEILIHKVHEYEGTVNELTGDGIMALFGAPIALEDASQRAIRSSLAIHREMSKLSNKIKSEGRIPPIKIRIGIHTGPVVVGTLGNDLRVEFKAVGDTVNLASRMQSLADPGTTYVSEETFKLTEGLFRFESLGPKAIKGKEEPVKVYRVIAPSTLRTRFDVSAERGLTPFVGRERELELLLDGFQRVKEGRGQAFSIVAEAGVGKSRFLYEFRKAVGNEDVTFLEGKCLSYSRGVAYHLIIEILKSNFYVQEEDDDSEIRDKVRKGLKVLNADEAYTFPCILELLSVKESGIDKFAPNLEIRKDRIIEALKHIVLKGSELRPLIMAFEDLHWIDKSSEETLKDLLASISGVRVLLLFTYRPQFVHTWGGRSYHSQITLNRLSNRESIAMMAHLLATENIERDLEELILQKTEGVPFFIEEFIKSLRDLKIIETSRGRCFLVRSDRHVTIPSSIQDVVMTRVDALPDGAKGVIQIGSVIEREFGHPLLQRVAELPEKELLTHLSVLKDSELIYERGVYPQSTYIFKNALIREVVYDSILISTKKKLHGRIATVLEDLFENSLNEHFETLSHHYFESENYEKAAEFSRLVAKKAGKTGSLTEAIAYTNKAVSSLEKLPQFDDTQKAIIDARAALGLYLIEMNYFHEAREAIQPVIDPALKLSYEKRICHIFVVIGVCHYCIEEDFQKAFEDLEKAMKISEKTKDLYSLASANYWLGYAFSLNCEFDEALHYIQNTLNFQVAMNNVTWIAVMKSLMGYLGYYQRGAIDLAFNTSREAIPVAEESGEKYAKVFAYSCHGISCYGKGFLREAEKSLLIGIQANERLNQFYWNVACHQFLGDVYCEMGNYPSAKRHYEIAIELLREKRVYPSWLNMNRAALAKAKVLNRERNIDLESLYTYVSENRVKMYEGLIKRLLAETLMTIKEDSISEAETWILKAIEADQRNGMMFHLGKDYALYAELFKRKGDRLKARGNLGKAIEILKECGADGWVQKYERELAAIS